MEDRFLTKIWNKKLKRFEETLIIGQIKDPFSRDYIATDTEDGQINYFEDECKDLGIVNCTGKKDKNDRLIFEGDIVETWKFSIGLISKSVVKWDEARCGFRLFKLDSMGASPQSMVNVTTIEIIGNIYENHELLGGEE